MSDEDKASQCDQKMVFDSRSEAEATAVVAEHTYGTKLKAYKCRHCKLWHLSSV